MNNWKNPRDHYPACISPDLTILRHFKHPLNACADVNVKKFHYKKKENTGVNEV